MHPDVEMYYALVIWLLERFYHFITHCPCNTRHNIWKFIQWYTHYFDVGYLLLASWHMSLLYFFLGHLTDDTCVSYFCISGFWELVAFIQYSWDLFIWTCVVFSLPVATAVVIGLVTAHFQYKNYREHQDMIWSYVDYDLDEPMDYREFQAPLPDEEGWGGYDEDYEYVENFVAPLLNVKISGLVGPYHRWPIQDIIARVGVEFRNIMAPGLPQGPFPWKRAYASPTTTLVYVRFKSIANATQCFYELDGRTFDGRLVGIQFIPDNTLTSIFDRLDGRPSHREHSLSLNTSTSIVDLLSSTPASGGITILNLTKPEEEPSCSVLNISCVCHTEYANYEPLERIILGLIAVPVIMFGILANVTSMRIFTHRIMAGSSINWYLAVLSASDTLILVSAFFVLSLPRFGEYLTWWRANYISYSVTPYMYGLMMTAQTCSVFMTVGVSVHRYIGVCHPYKSVEWLPKKRVTSFIIGLLTFSVIFNTTRFFEVHISNVCYRENIDYYMPSLQPTALRMNEIYKNIFFGWVYTTVMYVVPFTLLIALNSMVLSAVRRSRRMHMVSQCGAESEEFSKKAERKERQTSIMLVSIVLLFISCNTLALVCNIMDNMGIEGELYNALVTLNNLLVIINASCNICVYMLFSDKYRMLLRYYLFCDWSRQGELLVSSVLN